MTDEKRSRLDIDWTTTVSGALAAVTVAVLLSTLGAAGTLVGAAVGSVVATLSTAVYRQGLATSRRTVAAVQNAALAKVGLAQEEVRRASRSSGSPAAAADLARARRRLEEARAELDQLDQPDGVDGVDGTGPDDGAALGAEPPAAPDGEPEPPERSGGPRWATLPWRRIALVAGALFVLAVLLISAFELVTGRSVSSYTGGSDRDSGTSVGNLVDREDEPRKPGPERDGPEEQPTDDVTAPTPSAPSAPADDPTSEAPTEEPTEPTASTTPTAPTSPTGSTGATGPGEPTATP